MTRKELTVKSSWGDEGSEKVRLLGLYQKLILLFKNQKNREGNFGINEKQVWNRTKLMAYYFCMGRRRKVRLKQERVCHYQCCYCLIILWILTMTLQHHHHQLLPLPFRLVSDPATKGTPSRHHQLRRLPSRRRLQAKLLLSRTRFLFCNKTNQLLVLICHQSFRWTARNLKNWKLRVHAFKNCKLFSLFTVCHFSLIRL